MPTANFLKTVGTVLLAHTQQATATITVGSAVDVSALMAARIFVSMGRTVATALTNEVLFKLQGSAHASAADEWFDLYAWTSGSGKTACNATTLNGATSAAAATYVVTSATGLGAGDRIYLRETGTPANSEWTEIRSISGTTVTPFDALVRAHTSGITVTDLAERMTFTQSLANVKRLRLIVNSASDSNGTAAASGQTVDVIAWLNTLDAVVS